MKSKVIPGVLFFLCYSLFGGCVHTGHTPELILQNKFLKRTFSIGPDGLRTVELVNKRAGTVLVPTAGDEFSLRISRGTESTDTDRIVAARNFEVLSSRNYDVPGGRGLAFTLYHSGCDLTATVHYELKDDEFYMRKFIELKSGTAWTVERIDLESLCVEDAWQPYSYKQITADAHAGWRPGLGQPLYTTNSATFWGVEFPAALNEVEGQTLRCGYDRGRALEPGTPYKTYAAVVGVADAPEWITETFLEYIDRIRIRPLRLQIQYNSWFDYYKEVDQQKFTNSVAKVHEELVTTRGCRPLSAYVIDDGWQGLPEDGYDVTRTAWPVNRKFAPDFSISRAAVDEADSVLGLWLSPGCLFGAKTMVGAYRDAGYEALTASMSMCGPKYMEQLEERILELAGQGAGYFKLDGLFGHLNQRDFELSGRGCPAMPQLDTAGFAHNDPRLNDPTYDELKIYYLVAGTERLIPLLQKLHRINPRVFVVISNGAWLSPWWLQHVDVVWMINASDAAKGSDRTAELVYRDGIYYEIFQKERTRFPMNALFNHEPKKVSTGESAETFRDYLFMNLSRGTGFVELYIKPFELSGSDWDVLAEGLKWAETVFPLFKRVRMHGGDPRSGEVYGYTAWNKDRGYVSLHNPGDKPQHYSFQLNCVFGLIPGDVSFRVFSPLDADCVGLNRTYAYGEEVSMILKPKEIRIIEFRK